MALWNKPFAAGIHISVPTLPPPPVWTRKTKNTARRIINWNANAKRVPIAPWVPHPWVVVRGAMFAKHSSVPIVAVNVWAATLFVVVSYENKKIKLLCRYGGFGNRFNAYRLFSLPYLCGALYSVPCHNGGGN